MDTQNSPFPSVAAAPLFAEQTALTVRNMSFSGRQLSEFPTYIQSMARVKKACALANFRAGDLSAAKKEAIDAACNSLMSGEHLDQFPVDVFHGGGGIGLNMNVNEVIATLASRVTPDVRALDDVNMCQSTSDVCHTSLLLALMELLQRYDIELSAFIQAVDAKSLAFQSIQTIARTCLQDGMAVPLSAMFDGLSAALRRQQSRLVDLRQELCAVNLGGTVIGTGSGTTQGYHEHILPALREVTGLPLIWRASLLDAAQYPDDIAALSAALRRVGAILGKFAQDLRLLSSGPEAGFAELRLPAVQAGSSFFPGKVNPVIPETMMQCSLLMAGNDSVIQTALGMGEVHLNLWEEMMGFLLLQNCSMLHNCMILFRELCIDGIEANEEVCDKYAHSRIPTIVQLKDKYGYEYVAKAIKEHRPLE